MNRQRKTNKLLTLLLTICLLAPCAGAVLTKAGQAEMKGSPDTGFEAVKQASMLFTGEELSEEVTDGAEDPETKTEGEEAVWEWIEDPVTGEWKAVLKEIRVLPVSEEAEEKTSGLQEITPEGENVFGETEAGEQEAVSEDEDAFEETAAGDQETGPEAGPEWILAAVGGETADDAMTGVQESAPAAEPAWTLSAEDGEEAWEIAEAEEASRSETACDPEEKPEGTSRSALPREYIGLSGNGETVGEIPVTTEDGIMTIDAGDAEESGLRVEAFQSGSRGDVSVSVDDEYADTSAATDESGQLAIEHLEVNAGDLSSEDYGIGVTLYDYSGGEDFGLTVNAGEVAVEGSDGGAGIIVYDFQGQVQVNAGSVNVNGGEGETFGMDLVTDVGGQISVTADGDVIAEGGSGAGIRVRPAEEAAEANEIDIVVNGTVAGPDVAIELVAGQDGDSYDTESVSLTVWSAEENDAGEIVRVTGVPGEEEETAARTIEQTIQYIIRIAESIRERLQVTTESGNTVTIGEGEEAETYLTAQEGENIDLQISLQEDEELRTIYYNDDQKKKAEYTKSGESFLVKMLRGGAMLLGLDIRTIMPDPEPEPEPEPEPQPDSYRDMGSEDSFDDSGSRREWSFTKADGSNLIHGLNPADRITLEQVAEIVGNDLDGQNIPTDLKDKSSLMNSSELAAFNSLSLRERMMLMAAAMELPDTDGGFRDTLSEAAGELARRIDTRVNGMTEGKKKERRAAVDRSFAPRTVTLDGNSFESFSMTLMIRQDGQESRERYTFYHDEGNWYLYSVETGSLVRK